MRTSGARALWLDVVAGTIMDGGVTPPSIDRLMLLVPDKVGTSINDGHVTAAIVFGEDRRDDFKAGQRFIIEEMVQVLQEAGLVTSPDPDGGLRWNADLDGEWKLDIDGMSISIWGQRERRMSRDRSMLGERNEETGDPVGPAGLFASGISVPFELDVIGPRGGHEAMKFQVHPLALAIPPMTEIERESLRTSIARDGVKIPLVIFQKKILDGRHRGYFASILKKPVRIEIFEGTEEQAKRHVAILNLHRRHLNSAQCHLAAVRLFGEQAKELIAQFVGGRPSKNRGLISSTVFEGKERHSDVVERLATEAGVLGITARGIRYVTEEIMKAPATIAAIDRGEVQTVHAATKKAREERGIILPDEPTIDSLSVNKRLGRCVTELQAILNNNDHEALIGSMSSISEKLEQIETLVPKVRYALRSRNIIR